MIGSLVLLPLLAQQVAGPALRSVTTATPPLVLTDVTVIDVRDGQYLLRQTVVIAGNRIHALGPAGVVQVPAGARVVDARGKYLIPGLWDMHVHPWGLIQTFYPLLLANGVTGFRDPKSEERPWNSTTPALALDSLLGWQRAILAGTRIGPPRQLLSGPPVGGDTPAAVERIVDSLQAAGATALEEYSFTFTAAAEARRVGLLVGGHVNHVGAIAASDSGAGIVDHYNAAGGLDTLCLGPEASVARCRPVAERFRRNGTWWIPTFSIYFYLKPRQEHWTALLGPGSQAIIERFQAFAHEYWAGAPVQGRWLQDIVQDAATTNPVHALALARQVGLPLLAGTDTYAMPNQQSPRHIPPGFSLQVELALFVAAGLTPLEALQTATLNPAKLLHATDSLGTVAIGKLADLVLLDADPLVDIAHLAGIRGVVANGRYFDRTALDHLLAVGLMQGKQDFEWFGEVH